MSDVPMPPIVPGETREGLRDHLLTVPLAEECLYVREWGRWITVREMTGAERDAWESSLIGQNGARNYANLRARLIVKCIITSTGQRVFEDHEAEAVGRLGARGLDRVFAVCQRLNGLSGADVEALEKN